MDNPDESNSECELVSENKMESNTKGKKKQNQNASNQKNNPKHPRAPAVSESASKRMKKDEELSEWWDHFQKMKIPDMAECTYCFDRIYCPKSNGIYPLMKHMHACKEYPPNADLIQSRYELERRMRPSNEVPVESVTLPRDPNQEALEKALAKMIIVDKLPFSFVEGEGFRRYCKVINPLFVIPSRSKLRDMVIAQETAESGTPGNA